MKRTVFYRILVLCLLLGGCASPWSTKPIVKIGLVAPFEGRDRALGYEVLYAVKWAVGQRNQAGGAAGYMIELVALNDGALAEKSAFQARKFAADADLVGVIGPFSPDTLAAAAPLYDRLGLPLITPATCDANSAHAFCLGAGGDTLAHALLERAPDGAHPACLRTRSGTFGDVLSASTQRVINLTAETNIRELARHLYLSRMRPPNLYLYDGDALTAAELLIELRAIGAADPFWGGPSLARTSLPQIAGLAAAGTCYAITAPLFADLAPGSAFTAGYSERAAISPGPWAALAYDATVLLLDALERDIRANGAPSRGGVALRLEELAGPDGAPIFEDRHRRQARVAIYCYRAGAAYPGYMER